jgi:predicted ATP-grasp superfamily ATP-dependent carboligase
MATVSPGPRADLILIGANVRAAAFSALRGGLEPLACDLFADRDLRAVCPAIALPRRSYPRGFVEALRPLAPLPVVYTGGLENHPDAIEAVAARHEVLGNRDAVLCASRDPWKLREVLQQRGLSSPSLGPQPEEHGAGAEWLQKPLRGAGGAGIEIVTGVRKDALEGSYLQERVRGIPAAAAFLGTERGSVLLGVTRQLVGEPWLCAPPFAYCGSVGPWQLDAGQLRQVEAAGEAVVEAFGLRGLFGLDLVVDGELVWIIELNPRFPASVEVIEHALGFSAIGLHVHACRGERVSPPVPIAVTKKGTATCPRSCGKAILFSSHEVVVPQNLVALSFPFDPTRLPEAADVPAVGERIQMGRPIVTLLTFAESPAECIETLRTRAKEVYRRLG